MTDVKAEAALGRAIRKRGILSALIGEWERVAHGLTEALGTATRDGGDGGKVSARLYRESVMLLLKISAEIRALQKERSKNVTAEVFGEFAEQLRTGLDKVLPAGDQHLRGKVVEVVQKTSDRLLGRMGWGKEEGVGP